MENHDNYKCEVCNAETNQYQIGRYVGHFCPDCNSDVDAETFMAEHFSNEE